MLRAATMSARALLLNLAIEWRSPRNIALRESASNSQLTQKRAQHPVTIVSLLYALTFYLALNIMRQAFNIYGSNVKAGGEGHAAVCYNLFIYSLSPRALLNSILYIIKVLSEIQLLMKIERNCASRQGLIHTYTLTRSYLVRSSLTERRLFLAIYYRLSYLLLPPHNVLKMNTYTFLSPTTITNKSLYYDRIDL